MQPNKPAPPLENRFLLPSGWQDGNFINPENSHKIHYNFILPASQPKGTVVVLPGLSEFGEKYIETANFFTSNNYSVYIIDWAYQGKSFRFKNNTHKRHTDGFETDVSDLRYLITNIVQSNLPLYMLCHSMGGNIGLRYLLEHPNVFKAASFSAPMLGIKDLKNFYKPISLLLKILTPISTFYVPGGKNWHAIARKSDGTDIFSSDPVRDKIHNAWSIYNPQLQVGSPTLKWLQESLKSIGILQKPKNLSRINTPILLTCGEKESLVDPNAIERAAKHIPNAEFLSLKNGKHEIMMETDDIRDNFLQKTLELFNQSN